MGIGSLGFSEMIVIFVLVLVFFGPRRFPEIARSMGHAMREFRRSLNQIQRELEDADPRSAIPGRDILNDIRSGKPAKWLDPNSPPVTGEAASVTTRHIEEGSDSVVGPDPEPGPTSGAVDPAEQLPMFGGEKDSAPEPSTEDRPAG